MPQQNLCKIAKLKHSRNTQFPKSQNLSVAINSSLKVDCFANAFDKVYTCLETRFSVALRKVAIWNYYIDKHGI